jgi:rod shape-determining protein MreC
VRRRRHGPSVLLIFTLFLVLSLPEKAANGLRSGMVVSLAPLWNLLRISAVSANHDGVSESRWAEVQRLKLENERLREELAWLTDLSWLERSVKFHEDELEAEGEPFRQSHISALISQELASLPARVIFRDPTAWNSSLWIDVGEKDNRRLGEQIVAKNSPVVLGPSLVGIVEYVGRAHSRVRLITDSALNPSVRCVRGAIQDRRLVELVDELQCSLCDREEFFDSPEELACLLDDLNLMRDRLGEGSRSWYLAKGEMQGSIEPAWRGGGALLRGVGFNYDFDDEEGPARDLRTGQARGRVGRVSLVEVGDLLVTTGMDGLFPPGLHVGSVVAIDPLREGSYYYSLQAQSTAGSLEGLRLLFVLPPVASRPDW